MRIRQVDFPPAVLEAQRSGRLVLFAGAGVSMDPPSNYPDFKALASQVGGSLHPRFEEEAIDVYLGRLVAAGITVHEQARQILSSASSRPNANHTALTGLFRDQGCFRLVTTNFDRHFTTAAADRFGNTAPEVFYAPALPIGNGFTGIVSLHGSVDREPHRMVLTDSDFGRAYITEGWATRFLERLFSHFVVLFVGYSHEDMLLSYLARGLSSGSLGPGRFALTPPNRDARWNNLGITPIHYPLSEPPESEHSQLTIALTAWREQSQAGALAIEKRIASIVKGGPPLTPEDDDYLKDALSEASTLRFFTRHARGSQWLRWAESQAPFQAVFAIRSEYSETDCVLASWFAGEFVIQHIDEALELVRRNGGHLSLVLWQEISLVLFRGEVHGDELSRWVSLLLATALPTSRSDILDYILAKCVYPEDEVTALLLFEYLTRPAIRLKESIKWPSDSAQTETTVDAELRCSGSEHYLRQAWDKIFQPNLDVLARRISPFVNSHLTRARQLLLSFGKGTTFDPLSLSRGMIESREQDHLRNGFSVLIDAGVATMKWAAEHDSDWANSLINDWFASDSPLLLRLAIFGTSISAHISGDEKLRMALRMKLIHKSGVKHELFLLLREAYPHASLEARDEFLTEAVQRYKRSTGDLEIAAYELFNIVAWLAKSDPACELTSQLLARLKEENPTFSERTHPDMDSWIGPVSTVQWDNPVPSADLLTYSLEQILEKLRRLPTEFYPGAHSKEAFIHQIGQCAQTSHDWGITIAREAHQKSIWLTEIWHPLLGAWAATELTEQEWVAALDILQASVPLYKPAMRSLTWLLERGIQHASAHIPASLIRSAKDIADQLWAYVVNEEGEELSGQIDWLGRAINHPAGQLIEFYLHSLSGLQKDGVVPEHILEDYEPVFLAALTGVSRAAQLARVVLASQLHFLFHINDDWTVKNVFPILDPKLDEERAKQCWHGYLCWGHWTDSMLVSLLQSYEDMFPFIGHEKDEIRRMFCGHLSGIAVYSSVHPLDNGWLFRFVTTVQPGTRSQWAAAFRQVMGALDDQAKLHLWKRWLKKYWEERLQGRPLPLNKEEAAEMVEWLFELDPVLPEAVDLVRRGPYPEFGHSMVYYQLSESELLKGYPDSFADLFVFLTSGERTRPIYDLPQLHSAVEQLVGLIPRNPQLRALCDELARLGVPGASALAARLDPPYNVE